MEATQHKHYDFDWTAAELGSLTLMSLAAMVTIWFSAGLLINFFM